MNIVDGVLVSYDSPPKNLVISGVRVIGDKALWTADIESVDLQGVVEIRARAFMDCTYLKEVKLPPSLRRIGKFAFSSTAVETIELPYAVQLGDEVFFDTKLSLVVSDHKIPKIKLPLGCRVVSREVYRAMQKVGADGMYKGGDDILRIRIPRRPRVEDEMPRESIRQALRKKPKPKPKPKPKRPRTPPRRPRTPPHGPRTGECTICLKPSCEHLNMSRRLGAPLMW